MEQRLFWRAVDVATVAGWNAWIDWASAVFSSRQNPAWSRHMGQTGFYSMVEVYSKQK